LLFLELVERYEHSINGFVCVQHRPRIATLILPFCRLSQVGKYCTQILNDKKLYTRACTRSGKDVLGSPSQYVSYAPGDVTNYDQLKEAIKGASGVIFAASASGKKKGGDPAHVDYLGVYNTAKACLECGVPKLAGTFLA
jgi:nucleoside-diphosphate-sugar epimerase